MTILEQYDVVVVGSGPGGAITATLLAESGLKVSLIELGDFIKFDPLDQFTQKELTSKYKNNGITASIGSPKVSYVEGVCVGGGSEINSGLYHRTPIDVLEYWKKEYKVEGMDYDGLVHFFEENEKDINVTLMPPELMSEASRKLSEGAGILGWESSEIPRWVKYDDSGQALKQTMSETFIPRFIEANGHLSFNTCVHKITKAEQGWLLHAIQSGQVLNFFAKNLFVCAGAVATANLLRKNNLSDLAGKTLYMHPTVKVVAKFNQVVNKKGMGVPVHQIKEFYPEVSLGCSISSLPYLHLAMLDIKNGAEIVQASWENLSIYYAMTSSGVGSVSNIPFFDDPLVRYDIGNEGFKNIKAGIIKLGQCLFAAGATEIYPLVSSSKPIKNDGELSEFVQSLNVWQLNLMTVHLFSSCPMGEDKTKCVTDSYGKVWGQEHLYVNDASLLCTAPGVNPQGTIMMLARRNVEKFLAEQNKL